MPIIINEFEIITEPPSTVAAPQPSNQAAQAAPPTLRPEDIERIMRRHYQRRERVRAD
jgi:hypothetical protein